MNKKLLAFLFTVVLVLSFGMLAGCGGDSSSDQTEGDKSETTEESTETASADQLNVAVELFPQTLDHTVDWESWYHTRFGAGECLVRFGEDGNLEPWIAEDWEVSEDGLTWTFKLKDGVTFSNGEPVTATKVVDSINYLFEKQDPANGGNGYPQEHFTYSSITADDDAGTVTIVTDVLTPDLPGCLAYPWTLIIDVDATEAQDIGTQGPIMTGPYKFETFNQETDVQMVKNENYWDGEVPYNRVNIMKSEDPSTRAFALQDGSADMALNLNPNDRDNLMNMGGYNVMQVAGSRTGFAIINFEGVLGNKDLREAVMMAIDGETIADVTTAGAYTYGQAIIPSSLDFGYDQLDFHFTYDPEAAKKLLDDAGIVDSDGDGYRELNGENIVIDYKTVSNRSMNTIAEAQVSQLDEIGIKCDLTVTESQTDVAANGLFDLCSYNEVTTATGDPAKFMGHWQSESNDNFSRYSNPKYDEIYEKLIVELDPEKRKEYFVELQQILLDDSAVLVYGYFNYNICTTDKIDGVFASPNDYYWVSGSIHPVN